MFRFTLATVSVMLLAGYVHSKLATPPKPYICDRIFIVGNDYTSDEAIRACLTFSPGNRFSLEDLQASQKNLLRFYNVAKESDTGPTIRLMGEVKQRGPQDIVIVVREES